MFYENHNIAIAIAMNTGESDEDPPIAVAELEVFAAPPDAALFLSTIRVSRRCLTEGTRHLAAFTPPSLWKLD